MRSTVWRCFATNILLILYLHKSHNTPLLPPKNLHRHCFRLLLGHVHVPGEIANNEYAKFLGGKRGASWYCASSECMIWTMFSRGYRRILWFFSVLQINYFPQLSASSTYWFAHRQITVFCSTSCNNCSLSKVQWMAKQDTTLNVTQPCQRILMPTWCKTGYN